MKTWVRVLQWMLVAFALVIGVEAVQAYPARPASGVFDETRSLSSNDLTALEALLSDVRAQGEDIGVVVLNSLGGVEPRSYATALFNDWGLGQSGSNRGVLVLVAVQDRAAELILGAGIDGPAQQALSERIMRETMVPEFRAGRHALGAFRGAERAAAEILKLPTAAKSAEGGGNAEQEAPANATALAPSAPDATPFVPSRPINHVPYQPHPEAPRTAVTSWAAIVALPLLLFGAVAYGWSWFRRRARNCRLCQRPMQRLSETDDDQHLSHSERVEEKLGSVDYDVWRCTGCTHAEKVSYHKWFSSYKNCPACRAKTLSCENHTVQATSYISAGLGKVIENCQACGHHAERHYVIAKLVPPSTTSSYRSGRGGGRSSGGGSSRGGGASGRW